MIFEIEIAIRILAAGVMGGLIGYEREKKHMPAGFRTHILVCIGAALVMIVSEHMYLEFAGVAPARLGAQVISGIGFLGAGTIIRDKFKVKGLTTAASLWAVACIGLAVGMGYFYIASITVVIIFITLRFLNSIDRKHGKERGAKIKVTALLIDDIEKKLVSDFKEFGYSITSLDFTKNEEDNTVSFAFIVTNKIDVEWEAVSLALFTKDYVKKASLEC